MMNTIVVCGGQAGFALSYFLKQSGVQHLDMTSGLCRRSVLNRCLMRWDRFMIWALKAVSGLFFVGLKFQHTVGSHLLRCVGRDAEYVAQQIADPLKGKKRISVKACHD